MCCMMQPHPINENWNVSHVIDMGDMFGNAEVFNQHLNEWNMSNVQIMSRMFTLAKAFNHPWNP